MQIHIPMEEALEGLQFTNNVAATEVINKTCALRH
jgi:hypothetical protein